MKIENIFRKIQGFKSIVLDKILFESKYSVLFTCKNGEDVYFFQIAKTYDWINDNGYENFGKWIEE